jgi:electron transfer flavoprotein alpha subunit
MADEIWVIVEHCDGEVAEVTLETLGEARELAKRLRGVVCAVLLGYKVKGLPAVLAKYGAERVYVGEHELMASYVTDTYSAVMFDLIRERKPSIIIFGATANGTDLGVRLAAHLGVPIATDCIRLEFSEKNQLLATRPSYEDQVYMTLVFTGSKPNMATMRPGVIGVEEADLSRNAEVVMFEPAFDSIEWRTRVKRRFKPDPATLPLSEAEIVVAGGGGASTIEDWPLIEELARYLGASIGCSRLAADLGFASRERVIGQSGVYVSPRLYIGVGISGATHHTQGMRDAKSVIAINKDRGAPIFKLADLRVLSDLHQLLPELNGEIRRAIGEPVNG